MVRVLVCRTKGCGFKPHFSRVLNFFNAKINNMFYTEYIPILILIIVSLILSIILYSISNIFAASLSDTEKLSAYECGFDPFDDARHTFDIKFYLVAILFIIFDLEVAFLLPWALHVKDNIFSFWAMMLFLIILTIGFIYEWLKGALEWE